MTYEHRIEYLAYELAVKHHDGHKYGDSPYIDHLRDVVVNLHLFYHTDPIIIAAGWLHDVLEDTGCTTDEIDVIHPAVTEIVMAVTDEPGPNRAIRKAKTYAKIAGNTKATIVKLADRIANIERSMGCQDKLKMYELEYGAFLEALFDENMPECLGMWHYLDELMELNSEN